MWKWKLRDRCQISRSREISRNKIVIAPPTFTTPRELKKKTTTHKLTTVTSRLINNDYNFFSEIKMCVIWNDVDID